MSPTSFLHESFTAADHGPTDARPEPKSMWHHLSRATKAREASVIKASYKYFLIPGIGQVAGGLPNPHYFPFDSLEAKVARPDRWEPSENRPVDPPVDGSALNALTLGHKSPKAGRNASKQAQDVVRVPFASEEPELFRKIDVMTALQYGTAEGYPPLHSFVRQFTKDHLHPNCPYKGGPEIIITGGNTDGLFKSLLAFSNEWSAEKDWIRDREGILVEEFSFGIALQQMHPRGLNIAPVAMDDEGMLAEGPGGLRDVLANWDHSKGKRPHLMYTITIGQNPTSRILSLARRREIYALCSQYDIIIIEDDPYWFLQYPTATAANTTTAAHADNVSFNPDVAMFANAEPRPAQWKSSGYAFLDSLVPSYVSIDADGRVVRLDTFSKTVAPGCRAGWITAQAALIERFARINETVSQQPSGFVQAMLAELVLGPAQHHSSSSGSSSKKPSPPPREGHGWQADGWVRWLEGLRGNYERRMGAMSRVLDAHRDVVKAGRRRSLDAAAAAAADADAWTVVEHTPALDFQWPAGGMFLWLRVRFEQHPLWRAYAQSHDLSSKKGGDDDDNINQQQLLRATRGPARLSRALWVFWTTPSFRVLVGGGDMFTPTPALRAAEAWKYFRLCFAAVADDDVEAITQRLVDGVAAFWRIKDTAAIDRILEDDDKEETDSGALGSGGNGVSAARGSAGLAQLAHVVGPC